MTAPVAAPPQAAQNGRSNPQLDYALALVKAGYSIFPVHTPDGVGGCSCGGAGCKPDPETGRYKSKHPRTKNGLDDATKDAKQIQQWLSRYPGTNLGLATGTESKNTEVIDFDEAALFHLWCAELARLEHPALSQYGDISKFGVVVQTGDGFHFIFRTTNPASNTILAKDARGRTIIETRGTGGYIVAAGGLHPNGQTYQVIQGDLFNPPTFTPIIVSLLKNAAKQFNAPEPNPLAALVVPASDVAGRMAAPVDWLTDEIIEAGELVLITAPPGFMKSLLLLYWMCCVAIGRYFLTLPDGSGGRRTKQGRVLWVNTDNGQQTHENRLRAILSAMGVADIPLFSITTTDFELRSPEHVTNLHLLADDLGAEIIVLDTLSGCLTGINENSAEEMTAPAAHLRALAGSGRTVIGVHHPPKADADGSRGSSVLPAKVDRVFSIARDHDLLTIKPQKVRNSPSPTFNAVAALNIEPGSKAMLGVAFFDGRAIQQVIENQKARECILDALAPGSLNTRAIYRAVKVRKQVVTDALADLLLAGQVKQVPGKGNEKNYEKVRP